MHRYWLPFILPMESPGDGGGGSDVQNLGVPGPDESDLDTLSGGDEDDDDGDGDDDDDGEKAPKSKKSSEDADDDDSVGDEEDEDEGRKKGKKRAAKEEDDEVDVGDDDDEDEEGDKKARRKEETDDEVDADKPSGPYKALKTAYPDIFKKFPDLRRTIGEHQRFRSIFSSIDEAREVTQQAQNFVEFSDKLFAGDFESLVDAMEGEDKGSSVRLVKKVLPTIREKNKDLYFDLTEPAIKEFLHAAFQRANASGDDKLKNSTYWLNAFLTGNKEYPKGVVEKPVDPRETEVENKIKEFEAKKGREAQSTVVSDIRTRLAHQIELTLDPTGKMLKGKETTKKALVRSLLGEIDEAIVKDEIHMSKVARLWQQARRSSFSSGHLSRITNAYLERAKQVMPKLARKVREENGLDETDDSGKGERREERQPQRSNNKPPARIQPGGRPAQPKSLREVNPRNIDYKRTSDDDVLSGKVKLRRR